MRPLKRSTLPLVCGWRGAISRCSVPRPSQRLSNLYPPLGSLPLLMNRSLNWLPLSVARLVIFIGAAWCTCHKKSQLLTSL